MLFQRRFRPVIGLDITTSSIKLIELTKTGDSYRVESYAAEPTPPNAINEKAIVDAQANDIVLTERISGVPVAVINTLGHERTECVECTVGFADPGAVDLIASNASGWKFSGLVGLGVAMTIAPERLQEIRRERRPGSQYADPANCRYEVEQAETLIATPEDLAFWDEAAAGAEEAASSPTASMKSC